MTKGEPTTPQKKRISKNMVRLNLERIQKKKNRERENKQKMWLKPMFS